MSSNLIGKNIKDNSRRKFTGGGPRPDRNQRKRDEAAARNAVWAALSPFDQMQHISLEQRFGRGAGSRRQRARVARAIRGAA